MPRICAVPGCKSNYRATDVNVSVFRFPKDPVRRKDWIKAIYRENNFEVKAHTAVCVKHFEESQIEREIVLPVLEGGELRIPRKIPKLCDNACPKIFPCPSSEESCTQSNTPSLKRKLSSHNQNKRKQIMSHSVSKKLKEKAAELSSAVPNRSTFKLSNKKNRVELRKKIEHRGREKHDDIDWNCNDREPKLITISEDNGFSYDLPTNGTLSFDNLDKEDQINSFTDFCSHLKEKEISNYHFHIKENDCVQFYKINFESEFPKITSGFKIFNDLMVEVFRDNFMVPISNFEFILGGSNTCDTWSKFEKLVEKLNKDDLNSGDSSNIDNSVCQYVFEEIVVQDVEKDPLSI